MESAKLVEERKKNRWAYGDIKCGTKPVSSHRGEGQPRCFTGISNLLFLETGFPEIMSCQPAIRYRYGTCKFLAASSQILLSNVLCSKIIIYLRRYVSDSPAVKDPVIIAGIRHSLGILGIFFYGCTIQGNISHTSALEIVSPRKLSASNSATLSALSESYFSVRFDLYFHKD